MAKRKTNKMPKATAARKDYHQSGFMVRLPEWYRDQLLKLCQQHDRDMTVEIQRALNKHFRDEGLPELPLSSDVKRGLASPPRKE